jgi:biotin carboxyl carrier protein
MPGTVLEIKVNVGDAVTIGQVLLILEAMKMENELAADKAGTVKEIKVTKGQAVNGGDPLIIIG